VLRMEDIDSPRVKKGAAAQAIEDLHWMGLDWDEGPIMQSQRRAQHEQALAQLQDKELVYPCTCSRLDIERAGSAPHAEHEAATYPGTCAGRRAADADSLGKPYAWRFRIADPDAKFVDRFQGRTRIHLRNMGGDFVVWKADGTPAYQLAVVVDDAAQGITEVIRGDDLIPSTPRQLLLYQALGMKPPNFCHVPLVVGTDGRRLAKRHGDTRLCSLREGGVQADDLVGLLAWSCRWIARRRSISAQELIPLFRLETVPRQSFVLDPSILEEIGYSS